MKFYKFFIFSFLVSLILLISYPSPVFADVYVRGYTRKNGTYVAPHYRSDPDSSVYNNWSTVGNVNPHTGKPGTVNPDNSGSTYSAPKTNSYEAPSYAPSTPKTTVPQANSGSVEEDSISNEIVPLNTSSVTPTLSTPIPVAQNNAEPNSDDTEATIAIWSVIGVAGYLVYRKRRANKIIQNNTNDVKPL